MKNFKIFPALAVLAFCGCTHSSVSDIDEAPVHVPGGISLEETAVLLSEIPLAHENLLEVYDAVSSSSGNGYDEEYLLSDLLTVPGKGVGGGATKSAGYSHPIKDLIEARLKERMASTKSPEAGVRAYLDALAGSGMQIYWPYSEEWDGISEPVITFDPGYGTETNYGLLGRDTVLVDENVARSRPVWVINRNDDSEYLPLEMLETRSSIPQQRTPSAAGKNRKLLLKSFKMLRNYDTWFGGASEFVFKCGSVDGFSASTEAELALYKPTVTDFVIVVKRRQLGQDIPFNSVIMTDFTNQLEKLALLITEDDGGTRTTWKCAATVKVQSKTYGFDLEIPYNEKDDIVWRGQVSAGYFQEEDVVTGRFGDVVVTFELL